MRGIINYTLTLFLVLLTTSSQASEKKSCDLILGSPVQSFEQSETSSPSPVLIQFSSVVAGTISPNREASVVSPIIESKKEETLEFPSIGTEGLIIDLATIGISAYAFPLAGAKVISPYGGKRSRRHYHSGVDLKTCPNDTIVSAFDGVVTMAAPYFGYGNFIIIRHFNGLETAYSHQSKNLVCVGDIVKAGQPIGLTGRTGRATTEHLHFETRVNGQHFNPSLVFNLSERTLQCKCLVIKKQGGRYSVNSTFSTSTPSKSLASPKFDDNFFSYLDSK